jgi:hypothetical protein
MAGTVTFLFTDIEGAARLWEERPDEMPGLVVAHESHRSQTLNWDRAACFSRSDRVPIIAA